MIRRRASGRRHGRRAQRGVVLLALVLVLMVASSYVLIANLNTPQQRETERAIETQRALRMARDALLNYAVTYPDLNDRDDRGPGYLPCPDQGPNTTPSPVPTTYEDSLNDGTQESNCSESTGSALGRLPLKDIGLADLRDGAGERLWYAVSENFQYNQEDGYLINSEVPSGTIRVDSDEDIVAVIIAPGEALESQTARRGTDETTALLARDLYTVAGQYLEGDNALVGTGNAVYVTDYESGDFNDTVLAITRAELMEVVEQRVVNEVRGLLETYRDSYDAFPWVAPYADPKAGPRLVTGTHTGSDDSTTLLEDSDADFMAAGVAVNDVVWNMTDGSRGTVTAVTTNSLTIDDGLYFGTDNDFDRIDSDSDTSNHKDRYVVLLQNPAALYSGTAGAGSYNLFVRDSGGDFIVRGIRQGDIIDNLSDGSSGIVDTVQSNVLKLKSLTGGSISSFRSGHTFRIRSTLGRATAGSGVTTLVDAQADFTTAGIAAGDLLHNITTGAYALVDNVVSSTTLTVSDAVVDPDLTPGFAQDDFYEIARYNGDPDTASGQIPFHVPGQPFRTDLLLTWSTTAASGHVVTALQSNANSNYNTGRTNWASRTTGYADEVDVDDAVCLWLGKAVVSCRGTAVVGDYFTGTATTVTPVGSLVQIDNGGAVSYTNNGVGIGARVTTSGSEGIVHARTTSTLNVASVDGLPAFSIGAGEQFRAQVPSERCPNATYCPIPASPTSTSYTAGSGTDTATRTVCVDSWTGVDFQSAPTEVEVGDVIRRNSFTYDNPIGRVESVPSALCLVYTALAGGTVTTIPTDATFRVYSDFVDQRRYTFDLQLSGSYTTLADAGRRTRTVVDTTLKGDATNPFVTLEDTDEDGNVLGRTTVTVPVSGASGNITVSNIDFQWYEDDGDDDDGDGNDHDGDIDGIELPSWFIANRWHELIYISYSSELEPGGTGTCTSGVDCLTLWIDKDGEATTGEAAGFERRYTDRQAVVLLAGSELQNIDVQQDRTSGLFNSYFEEDNSDLDAVFETRLDSTLINDRAASVTAD
jgi:hypothetical protein